MQAIFRKILTYLSLILLFAFTLEVASRVDDWVAHGAPFFENYTASERLLDRDSLGIKGKAFGRFEKWSLNSRGFRGPEVQVPKPAGRIRIVALGASETFGLYEDEGQEWPAILQKHIEKTFPNRPIEIVNVAIVGLTISSLDAYYRNRIEPIEPDLVLLYPHFIDYIAGDGPHQTKLKEKQKKSHAPALMLSSRKPGLGDLRFPGKLRLAIKTKGPAKIMGWLAKKQLEKAIADIDTSRQLERYDSLELVRFDSLFSDFSEYLQSQNVALAISNYACAFILGPPNKTLEGMENLWRTYPWMSRNALLQGLEAYNTRLADIANRTQTGFVSQSNLLAGYPENWVADGIHFTNLGALRLAQNFAAWVDEWLNAKWPDATDLPKSSAPPLTEK